MSPHTIYKSILPYTRTANNWHKLYHHTHGGADIMNMFFVSIQQPAATTTTTTTSEHKNERDIA